MIQVLKIFSLLLITAVSLLGFGVVADIITIQLAGDVLARVGAWLALFATGSLAVGAIVGGQKHEPLPRRTVSEQPFQRGR